MGRAARPSWCALIVGPRATEDAKSRLEILEKTTDGFEIAERDVEARGPGDLLGTRQSGLPAMRVADPLRDLARLGKPAGRARRAEKGEAIVSALFGIRNFVIRGAQRAPVSEEVASPCHLRR